MMTAAPQEHAVSLLFHPVGQGLFASGHLWSRDAQRPTFNWVYDCGSSSSGNLDKACIQGLASYIGPTRKPSLDLVALSHFDRDHISGAVDLLSTFHVCNLLIPLVPLWQRLSIFFEADHYVTMADRRFYLDPLRTIASIPKAEIDRIILIPPSRGEGPPPEGDNILTYDLAPSDADGPSAGNSLSDAEYEPRNVGKALGYGYGIDTDHSDLDGHPRVSVLRAGARLALRGIWEFIPYNDAKSVNLAGSDFVRKAESLRQLLLGAQAPTHQTSTLASLKRHYEKRFKSAYARNRISLFLYAGSDPHFNRCDCACNVFPITKNVDRREIDWHCLFKRTSGPLRRFCSGNRRASVVYTGDGFLDTQRRWESFRNYIHPQRAVGAMALQVMHHGARGNWRPGLARDIFPHLAVFSSDPNHRRFCHPHRAVVNDFSSVSLTLQADRRRGVGIAAWL